MSKLITRKFLETFKFRPFSDADWMGFQGCTSPVPFIADRDSYLIIIDGDYCELYLDGYEYGAFEVCENIRELPFEEEQYYDFVFSIKADFVTEKVITAKNLDKAKEKFYSFYPNETVLSVRTA